MIPVGALVKVALDRRRGVRAIPRGLVVDHTEGYHDGWPVVYELRPHEEWTLLPGSGAVVVDPRLATVLEVPS